MKTRNMYKNEKCTITSGDGECVKMTKKANHPDEENIIREESFTLIFILH